MVDITKNYSWEVQLNDGTILTTGNSYDKDKVMRVSFIPSKLLLPRHDIVMLDMKFKKRFCRSMIKQSVGIKEYLHCVVTDSYRFYLKSSNGNVILTDKNYELYI